MARAGRLFEILVQRLEELSVAEENITLESPCFVEDVFNGRKRELDILLTHGGGNNECRIAFECKDQKRPVDTPVIEAFASKLKSVGVETGVVVSGSGFTRPCIDTAAGFGVLLHSVEQSKDYDWLDVAGVLEDIFRFTSFEVYCGGAPVRSEELVSVDGKALSRSRLMDFFFSELLRNVKGLSCHSDVLDLQHKGPKALNTKAVTVPGAHLPAILKSYRDQGVVEVKASFFFDRIFSQFGNFAYRRTVGGLRFGRTSSAFSVDDSVETLIVSEKEPTRLISLGTDSSKTRPHSMRVFRRLISWENLENRLLETGPRHHLNIDPKGDTLTMSKFGSLFDERSRPWDGKDSWASLDAPGAATFSAHEKHKRLKK